MPDLYSEILQFEKMNFNRDEIIEKYANTVVDSMDVETLQHFVFDTIIDDLSNMTDNDLREEIYNIYPELLD